MIVQWGTYAFQISEVATVIRRERQLDSAGVGWADLVTWDLAGKILNPTGLAAKMTTKLSLLEAAFATSGKDLKLLTPTGGATQHQLLNADCLGGTQIIRGVEYPIAEGPQYVTYRDFSATIQGLLPLAPNGRSPLLAFETSIQRTGGGPLTYHLEPLNGLPIKGLGKQATVYKAVQQGSAVGILSRPNPLIYDPPLWPEAEMQPLRVITEGHPKRRGTKFTEWPISWQYTFESALPLIGSPRLWTF
jgi:hypothetical protein